MTKNFEKLNILVTGATGYVGRNLVKFLLSKKHKVIACSRLKRDEYKFSNYCCEHRILDYSNVNNLQRQLEDVDIVFHVAAELRNWGRQANKNNFNLYGTKNLLEASKGQVRRFIFVSTEAVLLGRKPMVNMSDQTPYPTNPIGIYASSKQAAERMVLSIEPSIMECISVRPRMIWGRDDTTIKPKLLDAISRGRFLWIDNGNYLTSTTHIDNLCEGLYLAAKFGVPRRAYFITDGEPILFSEFVMYQLRGYSGVVTKLSLPRKFVLALAILIEFIWKIMQFESHPPLMLSQVYLTGSPVTLDDSLARTELGYQGKTFLELSKF